MVCLLVYRHVSYQRWVIWGPEYTVLGIDYFEGESVLHHLGKPGFDWRVWMPPLQKRAPELLGPWLTEVRRRYEGSKFFCVGA